MVSGGGRGGAEPFEKKVAGALYFYINIIKFLIVVMGLRQRYALSKSSEFQRLHIHIRSVNLF